MSKNVKILTISMLLIALSLLVMGFVRDNPSKLIEAQAHISPTYEEENILNLLTSEALDSLDYDTLFKQTGLSRSAIIDILNMDNGIEKVLEFQKNFFANPSFVCIPNSPISSEEYMVDKIGNELKCGLFAPLKNGDIILTKSSHTMNWRNGHAALVTDASAGETLESVVLGENSCLQSIEKWKSYPNYIVLRVKEDIDGVLGNKIAEYAKKTLLDVPYDFTIGIFTKKEQPNKNITGTHCSHLVWRAFMEFGIDIDSDGGKIVTPKDIANSTQLEVVQVYGMPTENFWQ